VRRVEAVERASQLADRILLAGGVDAVAAGLIEADEELGVRAELPVAAVAGGAVAEGLLRGAFLVGLGVRLEHADEPGGLDARLEIGRHRVALAREGAEQGPGAREV